VCITKAYACTCVCVKELRRTLKKLSNLVFNASALESLTHRGADGELCGECECVEAECSEEGEGEERYLCTVALLPFCFWLLFVTFFLFTFCSRYLHRCLVNMIHRETLVPERLIWGGGGRREGDAGGAAVCDFERSMCERGGGRREEEESLDGGIEEEEEEEEVVGSGEGGIGASSEVRGESRSALGRRGGLAVQFALMNVCASHADFFLAGDVDAREAEEIVREVYVYVYICM